MRATSKTPFTRPRTAIAAIAVATTAMIAASAAEAACGDRQFGTTQSSRCNNNWLSGGSQQDSTRSNDSYLGTVTGRKRRDYGSSDYNFGNARRPNRWDRRRSLGRGTFDPK